MVFPIPLECAIKTSVKMKCDDVVVTGNPSMNGHEFLFGALEAIASDIELASYLNDVVVAFRLKGFMIVDVPALVDDHLMSRVSLTNAPNQFLEEYDKLGLLKHSPVFADLRRTTVPISWSISTIGENRPPGEVAPARELFARYQITMGVFFPVHGADGSRAAVCFDGDREPLSRIETSELGLIAAHCYDIYRNLRRPGDPAGSNLTSRELEALHWAANGKTSIEIASILSLSDHTVNTYMNTAMRKLDCVNRTQLVAKALRLHLIS